MVSREEKKKGQKAEHNTFVAVVFCLDAGSGEASGHFGGYGELVGGGGDLHDLLCCTDAACREITSCTRRDLNRGQPVLTVVMTGAKHCTAGPPISVRHKIHNRCFAYGGARTDMRQSRRNRSAGTRLYCLCTILVLLSHVDSTVGPCVGRGLMNSVGSPCRFLCFSCSLLERAHRLSMLIRFCGGSQHVHTCLLECIQYFWRKCGLELVGTRGRFLRSCRNARDMFLGFCRRPDCRLGDAVVVS